MNLRHLLCALACCATSSGCFPAPVNLPPNPADKRACEEDPRCSFQRRAHLWVCSCTTSDNGEGCTTNAECEGSCEHEGDNCETATSGTCSAATALGGCRCLADDGNNRFVVTCD